MQGTPAGLPFGMPGMGLLIEGAVQHAPQLGLQSTISTIQKRNNLPKNVVITCWILASIAKSH